MAGDETEKNENYILYELLVLSEWIQDFDSGFVKNPAITHSDAAGFWNPLRLFRKPQLDVKRFVQNEYTWHLAVSQDGRVVAVLQETLLEIRTAKDEFSSVIGKASVPVDQCPQLRKLTWSPDNSFLAIARDTGAVSLYNLLGCNIATIQPIEGSVNGVSQPVAGLLFLQPKFKSAKWSSELLIVHYNGTIRSVLLSALDSCSSEENIHFSLENYYPQGITSVTYHSGHHILILAGPCNCNTHGITVWRILSDHPYLKLAFDSLKPRNSSGLLQFLPGFAPRNDPSTISKMRISPNGNLLACLHFCGDVSLWRLPGVAFYKKWILTEQPQHHMVNPQSCDTVKSEQYFYPVDISWWSNTALVIARRSGAVSVCSISSLENLLGDSPEFLAGSPKISSVYGDRSGVIALECEITVNHRNRGRVDESEETESESESSMLQASIQAALYSFTDIERFEPKRKTPRVFQRTYRLVALKRTTPEELYSRKIDNEDYEEALNLAHSYNLDCDLVYQKQWRTSNVSVQSIYDYLDKVNKIFWVINECVERVPETADAARELLQFGLKKTELDEDTRCEDLDSEQLQLISYRRQILLFLDNLTIYEKIISSPDKYNSVDYDNFRRKSAIVATVNFARQENWQAVSIMLTYRGKETLPHWLAILSNFPETLMPLQYRSLLPELIGDEVIPWEVRKLRDSDWCEKEPFKLKNSNEDDTSSDFIYESNPSLKHFETSNLTVNLVEEWYEKRTYEIEENTGLVEFALNFVKLARERNVKNLETVYLNLLTLESLVYSVQDEMITLSKLETLSHLEQVKLLLSKTSRKTFIDDLVNLIVPFAARCEKKGCDTLYSLIRGLMLDYSENGLELPLELLRHLKGDSATPLKLSITESMTLALDCLYSCPKNNQLENCFLILECLPERESSTTSKEELILHDRIDILENHLEVCEILERYNCPKSVCFVRDNEDNEEVAKQLMRDMAQYTRSETLDFVELLSDLQYLQSKVFTCVAPNYCYELLVLTQMSCECEEIIQSAEDYLECRRGEDKKLIPFDRSVELVLEASRSHFEKGSSFDDASIKLAQTCLRLISEPHPVIHEELDLIESVQLLADFDVRLLPLQVRKCTDRMNLIESCLKSQKTAYKSCQRLLQLSHALRICGDDRMKREGQVLKMIADYALSNSDYQYCSEICNRLISRNYSPAWNTVCNLALREEFFNASQKKFFLAFSILHCPVESVEQLVEARVTLHSQHFPDSKRRFPTELMMTDDDYDDIR